MKLGELRGAIRKTKGNPFVTMMIAGESISLHLQKTPLLSELDRVFPGGKAVETGLDFDPETGHLEGFDAEAGDASAVSPQILAQLGEGGDDEWASLDTNEPEVSDPLDLDDDLLV